MSAPRQTEKRQEPASQRRNHHHGGRTTAGNAGTTGEERSPERRGEAEARNNEPGAFHGRRKQRLGGQWKRKSARGGRETAGLILRPLSKKERSIRELRRHRYYDGRRDVWGRGQRGEEEPGAGGGERQPELRGEGSAPGRRGIARARGQLLSAAGREARRHSHTEPGAARCLRGFTSKSGSGSGKRNARDDLIQQKERGVAGKGLPKATGNQTPPRAAPKPCFTIAPDAAMRPRQN